MHQFDSIVTGALDIAQTTALKKQHTQLVPAHLLWGLINNPSSYSSRALKKHRHEIEQSLNQLPTATNKITLEQLRPSSQFSEWITLASSHAIERNEQEIKETNLLRHLPTFFPQLKIDYQQFAQEENNGQVPDFLINLNELAQQGKLDPVIGRTKEIRAVMEILGRRSKNNPVLVGEAGVGKTAIIEGLADAIVKKKVPDLLLDKTVYSLNMGSLMAGTKYRGEFEQRMQTLIKYIKEQSGNVLLFIDEIHQLVGAGKTEGAMDAANLLKPALARGELHCIGATTPNEYQKYILGDSALDRRFRAVRIDEPSKEDSIEILMGLKDKFEIHHGIKISDEAIYQAVILSDKYITDKNLPDKAIDLIDEASAAMKISAEAMPAKLAELESEIRSKMIYAQMDKENAKIQEEIEELKSKFAQEKKEWEQDVLAIKKVSDLKNQHDRLRFELEQAEHNQDYELASKIKYSQIPFLEKELENYQSNWILSPKDVAQVIARQTGIPLEKIMQSRQNNLLELESYLNGVVFGQFEALKEIAATLITSHAGLVDDTRPLGSFLLQGPSGVGKTETAKALSRFLFNSEKQLIRFDLSEYSEKHSVAKLIGAPAGYVGYDEGGILTEAIRKHPYAIILFDEIEKAHRDFSDILLQILDDGRLTDNKGRTINFKNTIIFMTTNSPNIEQDFKTEVLGRIDAILTYNSLDPKIMGNLVDRQLQLLNERLKNNKIKLALSEKLRQELIMRGHDQRYGARPLQTVFNKLVTRPLSQKLLQGTISSPQLTANLEGEQTTFLS